MKKIATFEKQAGEHISVPIGEISLIDEQTGTVYLVLKNGQTFVLGESLESATKKIASPK